MLLQILLLSFIILENINSDATIFNSQPMEKIFVKARNQGEKNKYTSLNEMNSPQQFRRKRQIQNESSSKCNCNCGEGNGNYCKCVQNFLSKCFQNSVCNVNQNGNYTGNPPHLQPMWFFVGGCCCCCSNQGNRRKQFRECNCHHGTEGSSNQNEHYIKPNINMNEDKAEIQSKKPKVRPIYTYSYGKSKTPPKTQDEFCKTIDVKKLYQFCKAKMVESKRNAKNRLDVDSILDFCNTQTQRDRESRNKIKDKMKYTQNDKNRYKFRNRPSNKDYVRKHEKTALPTRKHAESRFTTTEEKPQKNTSRTLGDYSSDYSMGLDSADSSSFGIKADSTMKRKVRENIERNRKLKARQRRRRKQLSKLKHNSVESSYDMSLGLKFPISRDEDEENDQYKKHSKENIRNKPVLDQIFDSFSFSDRDDEEDSRLSKEKPIKNKTRKDKYGGREETNQETEGNEKSKQSFKNRRERFDAHDSLEAMHFEHSDDLLSFSI